MNTAIKIITGKYGKGTAEQNRLVDGILGDENAKKRFETYFHWYNILHELGHGIRHYNASSRPCPVEEEQLVNDFAVTFWKYYGEKEKLNALQEIVAYALEHVVPPTQDMNHLDYAKMHWGQESFYTFNDYGWFQFSCVADSLGKTMELGSILGECGVVTIHPQEAKKLVYDTSDEHMPEKIIDDVVPILRDWGVCLPDVSVTFDDDPNRQMCDIVEV